MNKRIPLKYGLFAGVSTIAYFLLFYAWNPRLLFMPSILWSSLIIYLIFMWMGCSKAFEASSSYSFRQALKDAFTVYVVTNICYYVFNYLLMEVIDHSLYLVQQEVSLENLERYAERLDAKQFEAMKKTLEEGNLSMKFSNLLLSFGNSAIGGFILSLLIAGIFVKSKE